ncbi:hypothetical protein PRIPAC_79824 [Pristionchus pacificus]|uniref:Uncharacterized protein n=1 Tax=Pristionchus pacificus TaxID=54126 RepID=A0A2A6CNE3_PRIPA|nr:hypothetical protein PRIPAC_79824 [Pristionchus pacificus]|eukprot:PDM79620.1 hypothetical protein PRIPAC_32199 [Pristionchus pacificus]
MSCSRVLLFLLSLLAESLCRVTFTHSEVLQQQDLDASFKCDNGCLVYSDSRSPDMHIRDGDRDLKRRVSRCNFYWNRSFSFAEFGPDDRTFPIKLDPSKSYNIVYKGAQSPPNFVFYAVDVNSGEFQLKRCKTDVDTPVYALNGGVGYLSNSHLVRSFTVLNSDDSTPHITFEGKFETDYPRIYATGYDGSSDESCIPVYQAKSISNAINSLLYIPSPIFTVVNFDKTKKTESRSDTFVPNLPNSSAIYMSSGYVGCANIPDQIYYSNTFTVQESFSVEVMSLDYIAYVFNLDEKDALQITVNGVRNDIFGDLLKSIHEYDSDRFDVSIYWTHKSHNSSFAVQFDFGPESAKQISTTTMTTTTTMGTTTTKSAHIQQITTITPILAVMALIALF